MCRFHDRTSSKNVEKLTKGNILNFGFDRNILNKNKRQNYLILPLQDDNLLKELIQIFRVFRLFLLKTNYWNLKWYYHYTRKTILEIYNYITFFKRFFPSHNKRNY